MEYKQQKIARDKTGNVEIQDTVADAITRVVIEPTKPGDFNGDGCVDRADYNILMADIRGPEPHIPAYDLNNDGAVNRADARTRLDCSLIQKARLVINCNRWAISELYK